MVQAGLHLSWDGGLSLDEMVDPLEGWEGLSPDEITNYPSRSPKTAAGGRAVEPCFVTFLALRSSGP